MLPQFVLEGLSLNFSSLDFNFLMWFNLSCTLCNTWSDLILCCQTVIIASGFGHMILFCMRSLGHVVKGKHMEKGLIVYSGSYELGLYIADFQVSLRPTQDFCAPYAYIVYAAIFLGIYCEEGLLWGINACEIYMYSSCNCVLFTMLTAVIKWWSFFFILLSWISSSIILEKKLVPNMLIMHLFFFSFLFL